MPREIDLLRGGLCKDEFCKLNATSADVIVNKTGKPFLGSSSCEGEAFVATVSSLLGLAAGTCHLQRWITAVWRSRITIETNVVTKSKRPTRSLNALKAAMRWCLKREAPQLKSPDQQSPKLQSENLTIFEEGPKFWRKKKRPSSAFYYKFSQCTSTHQISIWIRLA